MEEGRSHIGFEAIKLMMCALAVVLIKPHLASFDMETAVTIAIVISFIWMALGGLEVLLLRKYYERRIQKLQPQPEVLSSEEMKVKERQDQLGIGAREVLRFLISRAMTVYTKALQDFAKKEALSQHDAIQQLQDAGFIHGATDTTVEIDALLRPILKKLNK